MLANLIYIIPVTCVLKAVDIQAVCKYSTIQTLPLIWIELSLQLIWFNSDKIVYPEETLGFWDYPLYPLKLRKLRSRKVI